MTENSVPLYQAGLAQVDITPRVPLRMAGYCDREQPSDGVLHPLQARALALESEGGLSIVLAVDWLGFSGPLVERLRRELAERHSIPWERVILIASHTHTGPVVPGGSRAMYVSMTAAEIAAVEAWGEEALGKMIDVVGKAIDNRMPATLAFGWGAAGFGVNRRRIRPDCRHFPGPVDHDVPVLRIANARGATIGVLFGYACHATVLNSRQLSGDWPGFACTELEAQLPGAVVLFVPGCGGDISPEPRQPRSRAVALSRTFGQLMVAAVEATLAAPLQPIEGPLHVAGVEVPIPFESIPTRTELKEALQNGNQVERGWAVELLRMLDSGRSLPEACRYSIHAVTFGSALTWIILAGEVVVDFSLRFRTGLGWERTWVSAYADELIGYFPSRRVWEEGGYEADASRYFGLPSRFTSDVEDQIAAAVVGLVGRKTGH